MSKLIFLLIFITSITCNSFAMSEKELTPYLHKKVILTYDVPATGLPAEIMIIKGELLGFTDYYNARILWLYNGKDSLPLVIEWITKIKELK